MRGSVLSLRRVASFACQAPRRSTTATRESGTGDDDGDGDGP
ncbi:MAG: hypothetical protein R6X02_28280 [Enhygromyxa sp.]